MPFQDNKRILLGDGILECESNIDEVKNPSFTNQNNSN